MKFPTLLTLILTLGLTLQPTHSLISTRVTSHLTVYTPFNASSPTTTLRDYAPLNTKPSAVDLTLDPNGATLLSSLPPPAYEPAGVLLQGTCDSTACSDSPLLGSTLAVSSLADNEFDSTRGFSLEMWIRPNSTSSSSILLDVAFGNALAPDCDGGSGFAANFRSFALTQAMGSLVFELSTIASSSQTCLTCASPPDTLTVGELYHVVASLSASGSPASVSLHINGVDVACGTSFTTSGPLSAAWGTGANTRPLGIGGPPQPTVASEPFLWQGKVYMMALYAAPLTGPEIAQNYASGEYNHVPVAIPATITTPEDVPVLISLNGTDPYDSVFVAQVTSFPAPGTGTLYQAVEGSSPPARGAPITPGSPILSSALNRLWYVPPSNASGSPLASFVFTLDDTEAVSAPATVDLIVSPVDDQPVVLALSGGVAATGAPLVLSSVFSVVDADDQTVRLVLQVSSGLLSLGSTTGLTCVVGTCVEDTALMVEGSQADINAALTSLTYTTLLLTSGSDTLLARANDLSGGPWSEASIPITVTTSC